MEQNFNNYGVNNAQNQVVNNNSTENSLFKKLSFVILLLAVAFNFITLAFNLMSATTSYSKSSLSGYGAITKPGAIDGSAEAYGYLSVIHIIISVILILTTAIVISKGKGLKVFSHIAFLICGVLSIIFLIEGLDALFLTQDAFEELGGLVEISTYAYYPILIDIVLYVAFIICKGKIKSK